MSQAPPQMTEEENEQVMKFLADLERMERDDPQQFAQTMSQLGFGESGGVGNTGVGSAKGVVEAISQLRAAKTEGTMNSRGDIKLPDGKTVSSEGVRQKQNGIEIEPEPGFVVKTRRLHDDSKVFINVCKHDALAEPSIKKKLDANGEEVEGMNIPLSVGPRRSDKDKSGAHCHVYDVIVNPQVIKDITEDITGKKRDFLCQLSIQGLEQKYKEQLDKRYKLPKLKYLGTKVATQYIQDRKNQPVIEELNVPSSKDKKSDRKASSPSVPMKNEESLHFEVCWFRQENDGEVELPVASLRPDDKGSFPVYIEPTANSEDDATHLLFSAHVDMAICGTGLDNICVKVSAFKLFVAVKGYRPVSIPLPVAVLPPSYFEETAPRTYSIIRPREGFARSVQLRVLMAIDNNDWSSSPDPGSKPWLIAQALGGMSTPSVSKESEEIIEDSGSNDLPEDKFHISLPDGVDKYTGQKLEYDDNSPNILDDVLPEDKFHKADASSQYIIEQRELEIKKKWEKHEKEKAERQNDPNVEYVELDDYKVGGKYGPDKDPTSKSFDLAESQCKVELQKASEVMASAVGLRGFDWSKEPDIASMNEANSNDNSCTPMLSSTLWTELLD